MAKTLEQLKSQYKEILEECNRIEREYTEEEAEIAVQMYDMQLAILEQEIWSLGGELDD